MNPFFQFLFSIVPRDFMSLSFPVVLTCLVAVSRLLAQQAVPPSVGAVTITAPVQSGAAAPWRTGKDVIPLQFTSDAANGRFVAVSTGGDITFSTFLATGGGGQVAVGFNREGLHNVKVVVSSVSVGPPFPVVASSSAAVPIVYDKTPPELRVSRLKVNDQQGFVPYVQGKVYYTNASSIVFQGVVSDSFTPSDQIVVRAEGAVSAETSADSSGRFELTVDISSLDDGPVELELVALEKYSDGSLSAPGKRLRPRIGR